jgi:hypothetical protein
VQARLNGVLGDVEALRGLSGIHLFHVPQHEDGTVGGGQRFDRGLDGRVTRADPGNDLLVGQYTPQRRLDQSFKCASRHPVSVPIESPGRKTFPGTNHALATQYVQEVIHDESASDPGFRSGQRDRMSAMWANAGESLG